MNKHSITLLSTAMLALTGGAHAADAGAHWTACGVGYSQHLSSTSDKGGDVKLGLTSCSRTTATGVVQTFELGALADTPPAGRRNIVMEGGVPAMVTGVPSNQRDTFQTFAGFGAEFDMGLGSAALVNARVGVINGISTSIVRGFIDAEHRWEGSKDSRHSPLSSSSRPLVQLSGTLTSELVGVNLGQTRVGLSEIENITVGTGLDALTVGLQLSAKFSGTAPVLPAGLPGMPLRVASGTNVYAGVFAQGTAYDIASVDAGTKRVSTYAKAGVSLALGKHASLGIEYTHPLSARVQQQYINGYDYIGATLGYRF
ncbi:hypothetical protein [Burkholderia ubonensis]|nr:hypothetical protein [Burkholderia ubonensis]KVZ93030.1 hypothetical protein WL25_19030 [Burkholderia ubonensis]